MNSEVTVDSQSIEEALLDAVKTLHPQRKSQVLDFARWLQTQPINSEAPSEEPSEDLLDEEVTKAELEAEEEAWEAAYLANREQFRAMARQALDELEAGETTEIVIKDGKIRSQ